MKIYTAKNAEIGEGVEATVLFHKDTGDELICVHDGTEAFEEQNSKAKECKKGDADKLLAKESLKIRIPSRKEIRKKEKKLKDADIAEEISNEATTTSDVAKIEEKDEDGNEVQKLTYYEDVEIKSVNDFLAAQEAKKAEVEEVEIVADEDVLGETPIEESPIEEEKPQ